MIYLLHVSFFNVDSLIKVAPPRLYNSTNIIAPARKSSLVLLSSIRQSTTEMRRS